MKLKKNVNELLDNLVIEPLLQNGKIPFSDWGWNAATDIKVPNGNELMISGSYTLSGDKANDMANFLKDKLEKRSFYKSEFLLVIKRRGRRMIKTRKFILYGTAGLSVFHLFLYENRNRIRQISYIINETCCVKIHL